MLLRSIALASASFVVVISAVGCPAPEPPPLKGVQVATITGEVFVEDPDLRSVGGAVVTVLGTPASDVSEEGKQFVLDSVALGTRTVSIVDEELGRSTQFDVELSSPFQTLTLDDADTTLLRSASVTGSVSGFDDAARPQVFLVGGTSQVALVGGDGSFRLDNLPARSVTLGIAAPGKGLVLVDVDLGEGEVKALDPVVLAASAIGGLKIAGTVQLAGQIDHTGTTVILNGGEQVVGSADDGSYVFKDLSPGLYEVRAQRPGFRSVVMQTVALSDDGDVSGLFDAFLAPGEDNVDVVVDVGGEGEGEEEADTLDAFIDNPRQGDRVFVGDELVLGARLGGTLADAVAPSEITWGFAIDGGPVTPLGTGAVLLVDTADVTTLVGEVEIVLSVAHGGLVDEDRVVVFVDELVVVPTFNARVDLGVGGSAIALPSLTVDPDGTVHLPMSETQPVALSATVLDGRGVDVSGSLDWASDTGFLFTGPDAAFSILPIGTHRFDVRFRDGAALVDAATVVVDVAALALTATIEAPLATAAVPAPRGDAANNPPYFDDTGVPLLATVRHPFQLVFPATAGTWRDSEGNVVAVGPLLRQVDGSFRFTGRTRSLAAGAHVLTFDLTDLQGNTTSTTTTITVQDVVFTADFVAPAVNAEAEEGDAVTVDVDVVHSLLGNGLDRSALTVTYTSSLIGLLRDAGGASVFGVDATPALVGMGIGRHTLTARVSDGRGVALAARDIVVRRPGVIVNVLEPRDDSVFSPGLPVRFTATAVEDDADDDPTYRWLIDGVEIDASYDDYGVDATSLNRLSINLGNFTPAAGIFADARLVPGDHVLSFCATLEGVDSCRTARFKVPPAVFDLCPNTTARTIAAGVTETWAGLRRLNCDVTVSGGTLVIPPGARIIVDDAGAQQRVIRIGALGGQILVGDAGSNQPAVLEANVAAVDAWEGFQLETPSNVSALVRVENTVIRDTDASFGRSNFDGDLTRLELRNVRFERVGAMWGGLCPDVVDGAVLDNRDFATNNVAWSEDAFSVKCLTPRTYRRLDIENAVAGPELLRSVNVTIEDSVFKNLNDNALDVETNRGGVPDGTLTVRRSRFENIGRGNGGDNTGITLRGCSKLVVEDSEFVGNVQGISEDPDECDLSDVSRLHVTRSVFMNNDVGLSLLNGMGPPAELRLNLFQNNVNDIVAESNDLGSGARYGTDVDARGNFFATSAPTVRGLAAGRTVNLAAIRDFFDDPNRDRVVRTTPGLVGAAAAGPDGTARTALVAPDQDVRVPVGGCVVPAVFALDGPVSFVSGDVLAEGECAAFFTGASGDPDGLDLVPVDVDADGCLDVDLAAGEHGLAVHCAHEAGVDVHLARFLVADAFGGDLGPKDVTWSGVVTLDSDVTVPFGTTLTIAPGTQVLFSGNDRTTLQRFPNNADNPDGSDNGCSQCFTDRAVNATFGERGLVDLFVDGSLVAVGTDQAPIVFRAADGIDAQSRWGGIRASLGASLTFDRVEIHGADIAIQGEYAPIDPFNEPLISLDNSVVGESRIGMRGPCPTSFTGNRFERVPAAMSTMFCSSNIVLRDSDFIDVGDPTASFNAVTFWSSYTSGGTDNASIVFDNVTFDRLGGTRLQNAAGFDRFARFATIALVDSDFHDVGTALFVNGERTGLSLTVLVNRSTFDNFDTAFAEDGFIDLLDIDQSRFSNGARISSRNDPSREIEITRSSFSAVARPLDVMDIDGSNTFRIDVNGNSFDGCTTCFEFRTAFNALQDNQLDISGNNFTNNTAVLVVRPDNLDADTKMSVDVTGSFFGTTSAPAIEALITDPQADLGVDFDGRSHYAPFASTPLTLDLLP